MDFFLLLSCSERLSRQTLKCWFDYAVLLKWNDKWKTNFPIIISDISGKKKKIREDFEMNVPETYGPFACETKIPEFLTIENMSTSAIYYKFSFLPLA